MRWAYIALVSLHGLVHLMGFAQAFGLAELPQLSESISRPLGVLWLVSALTLLTTAVRITVASRHWWAAGFLGVLLSQAVIVSAWNDAKFGTVANVIVLTGVAYGFASNGPMSFRAAYLRKVRAHVKPGIPAALVEGDLAALPEAVQRYVRLTGSVGHPRVRHFKAVWKGRIRAKENDPWMAFSAEQYNFPREPARFFHMDAVRGGLPVDVFHAFEHESAAMRVRLLSLLSLVDARGPEMDQAETVTLFNDLCLLAPAALVDPRIQWEEIDAQRVRGHYTAGPNTISAVLSFNDAGELTDFVSDDRFAASSDGKRFERKRWSTPVGDYRNFGPRRAASRGEGRWHSSEGEFAYIELELSDLEINGPE